MAYYNALKQWQFLLMIFKKINCLFKTHANQNASYSLWIYFILIYCPSGKTAHRKHFDMGGPLKKEKQNLEGDLMNVLAVTLKLCLSKFCNV